MGGHFHKDNTLWIIKVSTLVIYNFVLQLILTKKKWLREAGNHCMTQ